MFSPYAMSPNVSCPPMEHSYSTSSEDSIQPAMPFFYRIPTTATEMDYLNQSTSSPSYAPSFTTSSSFSSSPFESSFESPFDSASSAASSFSPSFDTFDSHSYNNNQTFTPPIMECGPADIPMPLNQYFPPMPAAPPAPANTIPAPAPAPAPTSNNLNWTMQMSPVEEEMFHPLETYYESEARPSKPFACTDCGKAFTRPADLKRHQSSVHNPVFQDCPVEECLRKDGNGFPRRDHLIEHLRSYHHWDVPKKRVVRKVGRV